ncbi:MAG: hypothetical protein KOO60_01860 [Gemmatimonadales bacterium]|nr:hypothetical protein [Gemmatimonadales bacterium]
MKEISKRSIIAILALLVSFSSSVFATELDEHLRDLKPLMGAEWVGGYAGEKASADALELEFVLRFEPILGGKVVLYSREVEAANFSGVTHFFWNPQRSEVCYINLNNRGIVEEGFVESDSGGIVLHGKSYWSDRTVEVKTTLMIDANGTLTDTFMRQENGQWVEGHVQKFVAK